MKKKLLSIKISGIKEFEEKPIIFITEDNVQKQDNSTFSVFDNNENINIPRSTFFYGKNASGKSHILNLINMAESFSDINSCVQNYVFKYGFYATFKKEIKIESFYSINNFLIKQTLRFKIVSSMVDIQAMDGSNIYAMNIIEEKAQYLNITPRTLTKDLINYFNNTEEWNNNSHDIDLSKYYTLGTNGRQFPVFALGIFEFLTKDSIAYNGLDYAEEDYDELTGKEIKEIQQKVKDINSNFSLSLSKFNNLLIPESKLPKTLFNRVILDPNLSIESFINIFDKNIEKINYDQIKDIYSIKYKNKKTIINTSSLEGYVSTGTLRGMCILALFSVAVKNGEDIIIDEIESNLNHKIVKFFFDLLEDRDVNKNKSRIICSTHYPSTLDNSKRKDSVYVISKKDNIHNVSKLSKVKELKDIKKRMSDYKNSKLVGLIHSIETEPSYEDYINFKKGIVNEQ